MNPTSEAEKIEKYFDRLWPICRSITGDGFRSSLEILSEIMPHEKLVFRTGDSVLDWTIPLEWNIRDAYLVDPSGHKHAEFKKNNLHLMSYSAPFQDSMDLEEQQWQYGSGWWYFRSACATF